MKGGAIGITGAVCLVIGFGAGFALRPVLSPGGRGGAADGRGSDRGGAAASSLHGHVAGQCDAEAW